MPARLRLMLSVVATLAVVALAVIVLAGPGRRGQRLWRRLRGALRPARCRPCNFALRDQDGKPVGPAAFRGHVDVLTFMYSTCKDTCPIQADQIRGALDELGSAAPPAFAVSVDPAGDTPTSAKAFLLKHYLTGRMRFLLGTRPQLQPIWKAFGIQPQGKAFDHSAYVVLVDRQGRQRVGVPAQRADARGPHARHPQARRRAQLSGGGAPRVSASARQRATLFAAAQARRDADRPVAGRQAHVDRRAAQEARADRVPGGRDAQARVPGAAQREPGTSR